MSCVSELSVVSSGCVVSAVSDLLFALSPAALSGAASDSGDTSAVSFESVVSAVSDDPSR